MGQGKEKGATFTRDRFHPDTATMAVNDPFNNCQSQSEALDIPLSLSPIEGLE